MTYSEAIDYLYQLRLFGTKLGLEQTRQLAEKAGRPQDRLRFIHVAGTNGKGSVCAMLESIYRGAGLKVGLFTSPHLVAFGERLQINRQSIPDEDVARLTDQLKAHLDTFPTDQHPTFFEVVTVMALVYFAEQSCDLVLWETGMGGRLDATNIVSPLASIITNVAMDHEKWLGSTLAAIAREKAGIIKPGVPIIHGVREPACREVIDQTARAQGATVINIHQPDASEARAHGCHAMHPSHPLASTTLSLRGPHQRENASLALACVQALQEIIPVSEQIIKQGLATTVWAGRLQILSLPEGGRLLLDGAHNQAGCQALTEALKEEFPGQRPTVLMGALADKDFGEMARAVASFAQRVAVVAVQSMRSASPDQLAQALRQARPDLPVSVHTTLEEGWNAVAKEPFILVTGSIYLVGELMQHLGLSPARTFDETKLNEWGAATP